MPHHWFNIARVEQEGRERAGYEREAGQREIDRLSRELALKEKELGALKRELEKLKGSAQQPSPGVRKKPSRKAAP
jgi:predicted RNase H-like nuclease (RuvC/YqgF family)